MTRLTAAVLLVACADPRPPSFGDILGAQVPPEVVDAHARALAECTGAELDLDGWTVWVVEDVLTTVSGGEAFVCPEYATPECGPPPDGYTEDTAPCRCAGVTDYASRRIAVTPSLAALTHELIHAGYEIRDEGATNAIEQFCNGGISGEGQ